MQGIFSTVLGVGCFFIFLFFKIASKVIFDCLIECQICWITEAVYREHIPFSYDYLKRENVTLRKGVSVVQVDFVLCIVKLCL